MISHACFYLTDLNVCHKFLFTYLSLIYQVNIFPIKDSWCKINVSNKKLSHFEKKKTLQTGSFWYTNMRLLHFMCIENYFSKIYWFSNYVLSLLLVKCYICILSVARRCAMWAWVQFFFYYSQFCLSAKLLYCGRNSMKRIMLSQLFKVS